MKKLHTLACAAILSLPVASMADTLSVSIGGGMWQEDPSGYFRNASDPTHVDVKDDLFWTEENQGYLFVTLEHPVPLIPNVRVMTTSLDHSGSGTASFVLNGKTFTGDVTRSGSFDQTYHFCFRQTEMDAGCRNNVFFDHGAAEIVGTRK